MMIEYKIEVRAILAIIKDIHENFLKNDPMWHFALEHTYILLRTSGRNANLETYLEYNKWKYTRKNYINSTAITRKYQKDFDYIYHGFALLAVTLPEIESKSRENFGLYETDVFKVLERIIHLACNNLFSLGTGREFDILWKILNWRHKISPLFCNNCRKAINLKIEFKDILTPETIQHIISKLKSYEPAHKLLLLERLKNKIENNYFLEVKPSKHAIIKIINRKIKEINQEHVMYQYI